MRKVRVALAGVGNCASSLVQGIYYYADEKRLRAARGLMHPQIGSYRPSDIEVVAAFDVDTRKVGRPLREALLAKPNCTPVFCDLPEIPVTVQMGPVLDGFSRHMEDYPQDRSFRLADAAPVDVAQVLRDARADVLISYLPVGSEEATRYYARAALEAGVAFINAAPVFIASSPEWAEQFRRRNLPLIGDDIKSQVGATIVHRVLTRLFEDRGVRLERTYQLNFGGNTDFLNMLNHSRLKSKKKSKTQSVQSQLAEPLPDERIHIGPSDYVPWLEDNKVCQIRMEGLGFGDQPIVIDLRLSVMDSPNSAGVMIDAVRCAKLALDHGIGGVLEGVSAYLMKSPPVQYTDDVARRLMEAFIQNPRAAARDVSEDLEEAS
ncbi:MAG: inositol-3-phosphate synthase [Thermaerobacter sp.]|nr:inositol-3-phosphate synthase [Bacillota bacterium]REJ36118.1 MAG: inositol-3-phosphate synthase [Bacillota bacterium]